MQACVVGALSRVCIDAHATGLVRAYAIEPFLRRIQREHSEARLLQFEVQHLLGKLDLQ